jgi:hypothetical protein
LKGCDNHNATTFQYVHSGADINTSDQVTGTNGSALPVSATLLQTNSSGQVVSQTIAGVAGCDPIDSSCFQIEEEFPCAANVTNQIGTNGWAITNIVGAPTITCQQSAVPNLGIQRIATLATSGDGGLLSLQGTSTAVLISNFPGGAYPANFPDSIWVVRLNTTSTVQWRSGWIPAGSANIIPVSGEYVRYDTNLANVASATCNDAGNKCGLSTLTCSTSQTVTFKFNGGTATGSVACTGTNAIANTTAVTVTAAGAGYNSTGGAAVGTVTGGTATSTGTVALTTTLGSAASGGDTHYNTCVGAGSSVEWCRDTGVTPDGTNFIKVRIRRISANKLGLTLYDNTGAVLDTSEHTWCNGACDTVMSPAQTNVTPATIIATQANSIATTDLDKFGVRVVGMSR